MLFKILDFRFFNDLNVHIMYLCHNIVRVVTGDTSVIH